jgi:hypothetical protein
MDNIGDLNSVENIHYRLLELLPVKLLRSYSDKKNSKRDAILFLLSEEPFNEIKRIFIDHMGKYKQHVFLFVPKETDILNFDEINFRDFWEDDSQIVETSSDDVRKIGYYFPIIRRNFISVTLQRPIDVDFFWPFKVVIRKDVFILYHVILERMSEMLIDLELYERRSSRNKEQFLNKLIYSLKTNLSLVELDVNEGIKDMWEKGLIDSPLLQSKGPKSTSYEIMDSDLYVRRDYDELYQKVKLRPLLKSVFHTIKEKDSHPDFTMTEYPTRFSVEPTFGRLYFNSYARQGGIDNVIEYILANN